MRISKFQVLLLAASTLSSCLTASAQDRPDPDQLRREARELSEKARDLKAKANEQIEESEKLARKAKELLRDSEPSHPKPTADSPATSELRREPRRDADRARPLSRDRDQEWAPVRRPEARERRRGDGDRLEQPGFVREELLLRRYHIRKAVRHLHAAGLHEQADRLEQRLLEAQHRFRGRLNERRDERLPDHSPGQPSRPERSQAPEVPERK